MLFLLIFLSFSSYIWNLNAQYTLFNSWKFSNSQTEFQRNERKKKKSKTMSMSIRFIINIFMAFSCIYWTAVSLFFFICNEFAIKELLKILSSECSQCNNFISYRQLTWIHNAMLLWCFTLPSNKYYFKVPFL